MRRLACSASSSISKCVSLGQDTEAARTYRIQQRWSGGECGEQQKWGAAPELLSLPGQAGKGAVSTVDLGSIIAQAPRIFHLDQALVDSNLLSVSRDWPTLMYHAMRLYHMGFLAGCLLSIVQVSNFQARCRVNETPHSSCRHNNICCTDRPLSSC